MRHVELAAGIADVAKSNIAAKRIRPTAAKARPTSYLVNTAMRSVMANKTCRILLITANKPDIFENTRFAKYPTRLGATKCP